jgi:propanediol dehydratase large subunit
VESCTKKQLIEFFEGTKEITTSYGKTYNFSKEHENAKPTQEQINEYLKLQKDE